MNLNLFVSIIAQHRELADVILASAAGIVCSWPLARYKYAKPAMESDELAKNLRNQLVSAQEDNIKITSALKEQAEIITVLFGLLEGLSKQVESRALQAVCTQISLVKSQTETRYAEGRIRDYQRKEDQRGWIDAMGDLLRMVSGKE